MIRRFLHIIFFICFTFFCLVSFAVNNGKEKNVTMNTIMIQLSSEFLIDENIYHQDAELELTKGIHNVIVHSKDSPLNIPIQVTDDKNQIFTLFTREELNLAIEAKNKNESINNIILSAIVFETHNAIPIGLKKEIITSKKILNNECILNIIHPIQNNAVNQYLLTIDIDGNHFKKYLILKEGVAEFLRSYNPLIFDIKEGKKISLFESEWVAGRQTESEIIYRDQQELKSILITTLPDDAEIYIGNELLGVTPIELFLSQDSFIGLSIKKEGYYEKYLEINMKDSKNVYFIELEDRNEEEETKW